jgi:ubiquinone/menaquinone biosynthesis C-methylase UbiE
VTGIDISLPMLAVARASSVLPLSAPITWIESNAAPLDVEKSSFDAVVCHQGLQFFPDRHAALTEMKRVLKPGGRIGIGVWGSLDQSPYFAAQVDSYAVSGAPALADKMRLPWSFPDRTALGEALERAGFRDVSIDAISFPVIFEGGVEQVLASRAATPVGPDLAKLPAATRAAIDDAFRKRLSPLIEGHRVVSKMTSNVAVARR